MQKERTRDGRNGLADYRVMPATVRQILTEGRKSELVSKPGSRVVPMIAGKQR
jgi:hypothetical protein